MTSNLKKLNKNTKQSDGKQYQSGSEQDQAEYEFIEQGRKLENVKMISFIDNLYSKFKLLNKLSEEESNNFQTEVIQMLIDENQNVDCQLYEETVQKIGLSTFVLEILGTVIQKRNKFKNQHQMNRNIEEITKQFDKKQSQITKRKKQLDKRQISFKKRQQVIVQSIKQRLSELEQKTKTSLLSAQTQLKKRITALLSSLKIKQKQIADKSHFQQQSLRKIKQFESQERTLDEKIKTLQKKQQDKRIKDNSEKQQQLVSQQMHKKMAESKVKITQLQDENKRLDEEIKKLNKKIKTNEMAYKHLKEDTDKKLTNYVQVKDENIQMKEEIENLAHQNQKIKQNLLQSTQKQQKLVKDIQQLTKSLQRSQSSIKDLQKQKSALTFKMKSAIPTANPFSNFQQLDISKIQDDSLKHQQRLFMTDRSDQRSFIHQSAESILIFDADLQLRHESKQIKKITKKVTRQVESNIQKQQESPEEDSRNDAMYFNKKLPLSQQNSKLKHPTNDRQTFASIGKSNRNHQKQKQKLQPDQKQSTSLGLKDRLQQFKQMRQQQQSDSDQQQKVVQYQADIKNIALFDNYFKGSEHDSQDWSVTLADEAKSDSLISKSSEKLQDSAKDRILRQLNQFIEATLSQSCHKLSILEQNSLQNWITQTSTSLKFPKSLIQPLLEVLLKIIEPCTCESHSKCLKYLFTQEVSIFLQQVLLKFEAISADIEEKSVLILSRVLLSYQNVQSQQHKFVLKEKYLKSLKVKLLIEKDDFIKSNIRFLMEYQ